ncbi:MAG: ATP-binding protein [Dehalococcoidia bacterium]|nr:ATP-binding protein [Dehalococcoidia bacterium]
MKELIVLSGKGGTGKTSITGCFAALAENKVLADCDVDAADLHLLLQPTDRQKEEFWSGQTAFIDSNACTECGLCQELCRFDAIHDFKVRSFSCEGCGFCARICPVDAITMQDNMAGHWYISDTVYGPLVHARLGIAQENSGKLVALVRQQARQMAQEKGYATIITDGPPGIGCPVISSLSGADLALLVTEPTVSGFHDLERVIEVCRHFNVPSTVCINKYDINTEKSKSIEENCASQGIIVTGKVPFDTSVNQAVARGIPLVKYNDGPASAEIKRLWKNIEAMLSPNEQSGG